MLFSVFCNSTLSLFTFCTVGQARLAISICCLGLCQYFDILQIKQLAEKLIGRLTDKNVTVYCDWEHSLSSTFQ